MNLKASKILVLSCLLTLLTATLANAQNVLDDVEEEDRIDNAAKGDVAPALVSETIRTIAPSKKIFILTNENQTFSKGDFISLLLTNKLVCRALVAKTTNEKLSGIKIVKIYNTTLWKQLHNDKEVLVLKGDDSYYSDKEKPAKVADKKTKEKDKKDDLKIQNDDDLFNSTSVNGNDDDLSLEESNKRLIKTDNIISFNVGLIQGKDVDGSSKRYTQISGAWGYQISDNVWAEASVGANTIRDYPSTGLDTQLINLTFRAKYTFPAPFYSYFQPYVGYQTIIAKSPSAGVADATTTDPTVLANELQLVDDLKKSGPIFGVTLLKRIVPGWFIRADLGTDIVNGGLTIEF